MQRRPPPPAGHPTRSCSWEPATFAALLVALAFACAAPVPAGAQADTQAVDAESGTQDLLGIDSMITVDPAQRTTIRGRFPSLFEVIEVICREARVELRAYGAADRPIGARYTDRPLAEVFERLLTEENFVLGTRAALDGGATRIAWLNVLGSEAAKFTAKPTGAYSPGAAKPASRADIASFLPYDALTHKDPATRRRAVQEVARMLMTDTKASQLFLSIDTKVLVKNLEGHQYAEEFINRLRLSQRNRTMRAKLDKVLRELRGG